MLGKVVFHIRVPEQGSQDFVVADDNAYYDSRVAILNFLRATA